MPETLEDRIARFIAERRLLEPSDPVLLMVSGGADSMCLLHVMARLHGGPMTALAIDHGLRPEAAEEVGLVRAAGTALGIPVIAHRLALVGGAALQERARTERYAVARRVAAETGCVRILTGHTASDQAETVLFRIARGTGRDGARGMSAAGTITRPLLAVTRDETRRWCRMHGVPFADDPSNADPHYARSRVRHALLPALTAVHPDAERAVTRFTELLDDEAAVLAPVIDAAWERCSADEGIDVALLQQEPPAVQRLVVRRHLASVGIAPDATWVTAALACARGESGAVDAEGGRFFLWRGHLVVRGAEEPPPLPVALPVPGEVRFGDRIVRASRALAAAPTPECVDLSVTGDLQVRGPRPGDRIARADGGHQAVGRLLASAGVPADRRPFVPVVTCSGHAVWVSGYRAGVDVLARPGTPATRLELR